MAKTNEELNEIKEELISFFAKLQELSILKNDVATIELEVNQLNKEMEDYQAVKKEYLKYSDSYIKDTIVFVDRIDIINLIEDSCKDLGSISSIAISDNEITLKVVTKNLSDFEKIKANLNSKDLVTYVNPISSDDTSVSSAVTNVCRIGVEVKK